MTVRLSPHGRARLLERGGTEDEVRETVTAGEQFEARYGRVGFRRNFYFDGHWQGKRYLNKQLEVYAVREGGNWVVVTVIVKIFLMELCR